MTVVYHQHHIIPKHAGGTDDPSNLIKLSLSDHAEAHRKLYLENGRWQDKVAWIGLEGMLPKQEFIKLYMVLKNSGKNNNMYGRSAVLENNLKWFTNGIKNIYAPEDSIIEEGYYRGRTLSKGRICSEESKKRMSESAKGRIPPNRLKVLSPSGETYISIKSAADSLSMTVSQFRHRKIDNGDWIIM